LINIFGKLKIYHAFWPDQGRCVAIKISGLETSRKKAVKNELNILSNFSGIDESHSHIIKIYGRYVKI